MTSAEGLKQYLKIELASTRAQLGISQEKMAENLNISLRSYSNHEHGKFCCSLTTLMSIKINCFRMLPRYSKIVMNRMLLDCAFLNQMIVRRIKKSLSLEWGRELCYYAFSIYNWKENMQWRKLYHFCL